MRVVIVGSGRVGRSLARRLADEAHDVTVVDHDQSRLSALGRSFNGTVIHGEAYDVDTLRHAGIELADVFLAVTDSDNVNLMATEIAKAVFKVPRAIARLYDEAREESYQALNVHHVTATKLIANVIFEQIIEEEFTYHLTFPSGDIEVVEFRLGEGAEGRAVGDLEIDYELRIAAVRRGDVTVIPRDETKLRSGDLVVAAAREGVSSRIQRYLSRDEQ